MTLRVAVLHPGEMGITIAHALAASGHDVCWVSAGRSEETQKRAASLRAYNRLKDLVPAVDAIVSVCPPHAAVSTAQAVQKLGFRGLYVEANAIAPATAAEIADLIGPGYVDGGIIGPPAVSADTTRLYLSGPDAHTVASWFVDGWVSALPLAGALTSASALKIAYAAYTKGASALLLAVNALAESAGVREALNEEWQRSQPELVARSERSAAGTSRKAWRFVGEMQEVAQTFAAAGLPDGFHQGAAQTYQRMAGLKGLPPAQLELVLRHILTAE